ncbi:Ig-like domain-containing protein [Plantactinospora sp. KLBMP9567]|uniref:Ig-like domain-containing protein n=1 Tax=Plantactinospora sp. KLBMP9567 TaxID=3085900 RepID=UPI0029819482|nr:Ig-like domain-containing protein [Plantactinospora sp. KLBMP9567]MDW5322232.1 Ig-like domain-containing protein [Plantactinospora sp. KLBMP9567]MDW5324460.1 Ig-like domain-containing protein [Plantactinospora sp. KLBMP9567]
MKATKALLGRAAALAGAVALTAVGLVGVAAPAQAAAAGTLTLNPTSGTVTDNPMLTQATTSAACPTGFGDQAALRVGPVGGQVANLNRIASDTGYDTAPFTLGANRSMATALAGTPTNGDYVVVVECLSELNGVHPDRFETVITVNGGNWRVKGAVDPAVPTTTALGASPAGPVEAGTAVTLTATVDPAAAAGTVAFRNGSTSLGTAPVSGGTARITTSALPVGNNALTAQFTPADPAAYQPSTSGELKVQVTAPGAVDKEQRITAEIVGGGLSLEVAGSDVALSGGVVGGTASGTLNTATVSDLRGTGAGWNLTGQVDDFVGPAAATIDGNQLGWTPEASKLSGSGTATAGAAATPGSGLGEAKTLCRANEGSSAGTFECGAGLSLGIPDTTTPGSYAGTLTLTLV